MLAPEQGSRIELLLGITPEPASDGWVAPLASAMNAALGQCVTQSSGKGWRAGVELELHVRGGKVNSVGAPVATPQAGCLSGQLKGKALGGLEGATARTVRVRVTPAT